MTWKDEIRKEKKDDDYDEYRDGETLQANNKIRDTRSAESYKTGDTRGRRSYTNKVRDARSADSYKTGDSHKESTLTDETKEAFAKIEEQMREAFEGIDYNLLTSVIMPHGRTYKDKDALISDLVKDAINRIKSDKLYR